MHTYIQKYVETHGILTKTDIHACLPAYIHTYMHRYIHQYTHMHASVSSYNHTYSHVNMHAYTHACMGINIYVHTYTNTCIRHSCMSGYIETFCMNTSYLCIHLYIAAYIQKAWMHTEVCVDSWMSVHALIVIVPWIQRMTWSVLLSMDSGMALQPQSGSAESEADGTLEDHCHGRAKVALQWQSWGCKLFCLLLFSSDALDMHVSAYQRGGHGLLHWVRRLDTTPLQAALQCVFVAIMWLALVSLSLC